MSSGSSSNAVLVSAKSVFPPFPGGGNEWARSKLKPARLGLKLESTWKMELPWKMSGWPLDILKVEGLPDQCGAVCCRVWSKTRHLLDCLRRRVHQKEICFSGQVQGMAWCRPAHRIEPKRLHVEHRRGMRDGRRARRTDAEDVSYHNIKGSISLGPANEVHVLSSIAHIKVCCGNIQLTLMIALWISSNTSFFTGFEKSTPVTSAPKVGASSFSSICWYSVSVAWGIFNVETQRKAKCSSGRS